MQPEKKYDTAIQSFTKEPSVNDFILKFSACRKRTNAQVSDENNEPKMFTSIRIVLRRPDCTKKLIPLEIKAEPVYTDIRHFQSTGQDNTALVTNGLFCALSTKEPNVIHNMGSEHLTDLTNYNYNIHKRCKIVFMFYSIDLNLF